MKSKMARTHTGLKWCASVSLLISCISCQGSDERLEAMRMMQSLAHSLHQHNPNMRREPGFPESELTTDDGRSICSWRLTILDVSLSGPSLDQPWEAPINQWLDTSDNRQMYAVTSRSNPSQFTQIFALVGPGTAFTEFAFGKNLDTRDAEPDAILLLECKNHLIHWMEPGDIDVASLKRGYGKLEPNYADGFIVAFVDESAWFIRKDVPSEVLSHFFTNEGAKSHDRDEELSKYAIIKLPPPNWVELSERALQDH